MTVYLAASDMAERLDITVATVNRWCAAGTIPATKIGRSYRVAEPDFDGFMRKYRGRTTPSTRGTVRRRGAVLS